MILSSQLSHTRLTEGGSSAPYQLAIWVPGMPPLIGAGPPTNFIVRVQGPPDGRPIRRGGRGEDYFDRRSRNTTAYTATPIVRNRAATQLTVLRVQLGPLRRRSANGHAQVPCNSPRRTRRLLSTPNTRIMRCSLGGKSSIASAIWWPDRLYQRRRQLAALRWASYRIAVLDRPFRRVERPFSAVSDKTMLALAAALMLVTEAAIAAPITVLVVGIVLIARSRREGQST